MVDAPICGAFVLTAALLSETRGTKFRICGAGDSDSPSVCRCLSSPVRWPLRVRHERGRCV